MEVIQAGQTVWIEGKVTNLVRPLTDAPGGWKVSPRVMNLRFWNEEEMKVTA